MDSSRSGILPPVESAEQYRALYPDERQWRPAIQAICQRHGLSVDGLSREELGTHLAFRSGRRIVKLFCNLWPRDFAAERAVLQHVEGLPTPDIVAEGEIEG